MVATPGNAGSTTGYVQEPLVEPDVNRTWTSDRELDRLLPLVRSLRYWAGVYERWRQHQPAAARPGQAPLGPADQTLVDELRGVHFGQLAAASQRLRQAAAAAARLAESAGVTRAALAHGWRDAAAQPIEQRFDELARTAQDCATRCAQLGRELDSTVIGTVAPVITNAVDEILMRSRGLEHTAGRPPREIWEQRIIELAGIVLADPVDTGTARPDAESVDHRVWRAELDTLATDYDAVIALFRATLTTAAATVAETYQAMARLVAAYGGSPSFDVAPFGAPEPVPAIQLNLPGRPTPDGRDFDTVPAPMFTMLASAGSAGENEPAAGSSFASTGGAGADGAGMAGVAMPGIAGPGAAVLGFLGESRTTDGGGATLGSLSDVRTEYGVPEHGGAGMWGSSAITPLAGAIGTAGSDEPQRTGRHWTVPAAPDGEPDASWERLRALLGEESDKPAEPDKNGSR